MHLPALLAASLLAIPSLLAEDAQSPLGKEMETLNDALKAVRRESDPAKSAALARAAQDALLASFAHLPPMVAALPQGPARKQAEAQFRRMLSEALTLLCKLEQACLSGDTAAAEQLRQQVQDLKKQAHDRFIEE